MRMPEFLSICGGGGGGLLLVPPNQETLALRDAGVWEGRDIGGPGGLFLDTAEVTLEW